MDPRFREDDGLICVLYMSIRTQKIEYGTTQRSSTSLTPLDLLRPSCPDCRHSREAGIQLLQASNMDPRFARMTDLPPMCVALH